MNEQVDPSAVCARATATLTTTAAQLRAVAEAYQEVAHGVLVGALPMPAQPLDWAIQLAAALEANLQAFRAQMEELRPFVSAELTAEVEAEIRKHNPPRNDA